MLWRKPKPFKVYLSLSKEWLEDMGLKDKLVKLENIVSLVRDSDFISIMNDKGVEWSYPTKHVMKAYVKPV